MSPLQYIRWRWGTRRAALATIRHIKSVGVYPASLVDAGARNSEFMRYLARAWPYAEIHSFEPNPSCNPMGYWHRKAIGPRHPLRDISFSQPALLKVDCDWSTVAVVKSADLTAFQWVVVEVTEDAPGGWMGENNRSEINGIMAEAGFKKSMAVDAVVCVMDNRVAQTDVLFWKEL